MLESVIKYRFSNEVEKDRNCEEDSVFLSKVWDSTLVQFYIMTEISILRENF